MKRTNHLLPAGLLLSLLFMMYSEGSSQLSWYWTQDWVIFPGYSPRVLKLDPASWEGGYHCWYAIASTGGYDIYYAMSTDGLHWLIRWGGQPVLRRGVAGDVDAVWAVDPRVVVRDSQLVMYYNAYDGKKYQTAVAFSRDGIQWTKYPGNPVLRVGTGWDSVVAVPREVIENPPGSPQRFTMYYVGYDNVVWRTGVAFSDDGLTWTRYAGNPVLDVGPTGSWDEYGVSADAIVFDRGVYYMFYQTKKPSSKGIATSTDRVNWTKYRSNPVLEPPLGPGYSLGFGSMLLENGMLRYWFGLESGTWGICYAMSPWHPDAITGVADGVSPSHALTCEAYPNPFNPATTIRYEVPEPGEVRLGVCDMLGREVSVLVSGRVEAGVHEVTFDGSGLASGIYFCRLTAGSLSQTRKLLLLR